MSDKNEINRINAKVAGLATLANLLRYNSEDSSDDDSEIQSTHPIIHEPTRVLSPEINYISPQFPQSSCMRPSTRFYLSYHQPIVPNKENHWGLFLNRQQPRIHNGKMLIL
jgi:hypothetical protein